MNKFKLIVAKLKSPSVLFSILFSVFAISVIVTTIVLVCLGYQNIFSYILYGISAISLTYLIYIFIHYLPKMRQSVTNMLKSNKFTNELY